MAVAVAALFFLGLFGCSSSGIALDREVEIAGLTMGVPSTWVQENDVPEYGNYGSADFIDSTDEDSLNRIYVFYSDRDEDESVEDLAEESLSVWEDLYEGIETKVILEDERVIDGSECVTYSFVAFRDGKEMPVVTEIFITSPAMTYKISAYGDSVSIDEMLETISIEY